MHPPDWPIILKRDESVGLDGGGNEATKERVGGKDVGQLAQNGVLGQQHRDAPYVETEQPEEETDEARKPVYVDGRRFVEELQNRCATPVKNDYEHRAAAADVRHNVVFGPHDVEA